MQYLNLSKQPLRLAAISLISVSLTANDPMQDQHPGSSQAFCHPHGNSDLPRFEKSAAELQQTYDTVTAQAGQKLQELLALNPRRLTFKNTILAFEGITDSVNLAFLRVGLLKDVHPDPEVLAKALELYDQYTLWFNETYNNGSLYKVLNAYARTNPRLAPDEQKLMMDIVTTFKRNGLTEDGVVNPQVLALQTEIVDLQSQITRTVTEANAAKNYFTAAELAGLSQEQLDGLDREGDNYVILSGDRGTLRDVVMGYALSEDTRWRAKFISNSRAMGNLDLITTLVKKRLELAKVLGYNSWADYRTELAMAKTGAAASDFSNVVSARLHPKLEQELQAAGKYLVQGVNDNNGQVDAWDVSFFRRLYQTNDLNVDYGSLTKYFPYQQVLTGMFKVYEKSFNIKIDFVSNPEVWHPSVQLVKISDRSHHGHGNETLGYMYLDMFPRLEQGKLSHFAAYNIINGRSLNPGRYRKPVASLVCNFPVDAAGTPENLLFEDIATLFHEFGHGLHVVLGKARFASQSGFSVPQDFVEVPSTMSEQWIYDPEVFKILAIDDPAITDAFVAKTVADMRNADRATIAMYYERQFGFNKTDFALHMFTDASQVPDPSSANNLSAMANEAMATAYLPYPAGSGQLSSFLHILSWGYDAGYYSYAWSDSIVAELAILFDESPQGYLDRRLGMRYRKEILEPGASRDVNESVLAFTGKPLDPERKAFLKRLGLE